MSVRRRIERDPLTGAPYEVWLVDVVFQHPDGRKQRIKKKSPVQTRRGAEDYERQLRNALLEVEVEAVIDRSPLNRLPARPVVPERLCGGWGSAMHRHRPPDALCAPTRSGRHG